MLNSAEAKYEKIRLRAIDAPAAILDCSSKAMDLVWAAERELEVLKVQWGVAQLARIFELHPELAGFCVDAGGHANRYRGPDIHTNRFTCSSKPSARPEGSGEIPLDADAKIGVGMQVRKGGFAPDAPLQEALESWGMECKRLGCLRRMRGAFNRRNEADVLPDFMRQVLDPVDFAKWESAALSAAPALEPGVDARSAPRI